MEVYRQIVVWKFVVWKQRTTTDEIRRWTHELEMTSELFVAARWHSFALVTAGDGNSRWRI